MSRFLMQWQIPYKNVLWQKMNPSLLVEYELHAFPRLKLLQVRLTEFMETRTTHSPLIRFVCHDVYAIKELTNTTSRFSVKGVPGKCLKQQDGSDSALIVTVCILQPDKSGKLATKDKILLEGLKRSVPELDVNTVLYIIDTTQCTLSALNYCSQEIAETVEPSSLVNTVCNRLFQIESSEISVRISLYFEKCLLNKIPIKIANIAAIEKILSSPQFAKETTNKLSEGLLERSKCQTFLRRKAVDYRWEGEQHLRLPWNIEDFKRKLKDHLCKCLSKRIAADLVNHLNYQLRSSKVYIANESGKMVDLSTLKTKHFALLPTAVISSIIGVSLGIIPALAAIAFALVFSADVVNFNFRHKVADALHECIMAKKEELLRHVLQRFREDFLENINNMCNVLKEFERRNNISISFHEYKTITERISAVKACGLFGNTIKICIDKTETPESIRKYLRQLNADISFLEICEYREITTAKHAFKSGNKIKLSLNSEERYGTVSFPMKDRNSQYYCATCRHITVSSQFEIETDVGIILPASEYYNAKDLDFSLLKLQNLQNTKIICKHGIRTEKDCFVSGEVLENDLLPNEDTVVYKWGATTGLTEGLYKGIICTKKLENGKYNIETFIIEGQSGHFSRPGDSGALVCMKPDSNVYTSYMAAFVLIGELDGFDGMNYTNMHACYRVSVPLMEMDKDRLCSNIKPCFSIS